MLKFAKIVPMLVVGIFLLQNLFPDTACLAAPGALPNCGHNVVGNSSDSGWPDIAVSNDANRHYTAIVWSEGTGNDVGKGTLKLAYSQAFTTARSWQLDTGVGSIVDDGTTGNSVDPNVDPVIVFDAVLSNTVHIAYKKEINQNSEIYYAKCTLGGACTTTRASSASVNPTITRKAPEIAVNSAGDVVIVYEELDNSIFVGGPVANNWLNYAYKKAGSNTFTQFEGGTAGNNKLGLSNAVERNVTLAAVEDTLHIAYAESTESGGVVSNVSDGIRYMRMDIGTAGLNGTALVTDTPHIFENGFDTTNPDFPALVVLPDGGTANVGLAWQLEDANNPWFNLAYSLSTDNGANWNSNLGPGELYNYIPSNTTATGASLGQPAVVDDIEGFTGEFDKGLMPDIALHKEGSNLFLHVAWHQNSPVNDSFSGNSASNRTDVMYSYKNATSGGWTGTPVLDRTTLVSNTNVTGFHGYSEKLLNDSKEFFKLRPKILFGDFGAGTHQVENRLQVVYANFRNSTRQVRYNGWQLGSGFLTPIRTEQDSDCDTMADYDEMPLTGVLRVCTDPLNSDYLYDGDLGGEDDDPGYANCDYPGDEQKPFDFVNGDFVPDYLDTNSDGDFREDDVDKNPYAWDRDGGIFLPTVLKNS